MSLQGVEALGQSADLVDLTEHLEELQLGSILLAGYTMHDAVKAPAKGEV